MDQYVKWIVLLAGVTIAALPLVTVADEATSPDGRKTFEIVMKNHEFTPLELVVPANQKLKITLKNQDKSPIEFESAQLNREKIVQPDGEVTVLFNELQPGTYAYFDDFNRDSKGFITVK